MADDIEHLKVRKIELPLVKREGSRVALGVFGQREPEQRIREATGGTGAAPAPVDREVLRERVVETLKSIFDPEIPLNIYDLGLI